MRRELFRSLSTVMWLLAAGLAGCASSTPPSDGSTHAECTVCSYNADLACVDVVVDKDTPQSQYGGRTFYFCSEECKGTFDRQPAKYLKP